MNNAVAKIFTGKLYFLTELAVSCSLYSMVTLIFYYYTADESFFNAFIYCGIFVALQVIWQIIQEKHERENEEGENYPLKISIFFFITIIVGAAFTGFYFIFFHDVMTLTFRPIGPLNLLDVQRIDSKPDDYIRIRAFYDDYYALTFSLNIIGEDNEIPVDSVGCGCGADFGPLLGTIASPVSSNKYKKSKFDDIVLFPTMTCFCHDKDDCYEIAGNRAKDLYYRVNGNYTNAIKNTQCPPPTMDFIQIFTNPTVKKSNAQIILLFTLAYIPMMFGFLNFFINAAKMGFIAFTKSHPNIRTKGVTLMVLYYFLKWAVLAAICFFIFEEISNDRANILIYAIGGLACFPGIIFGFFFFIYNPNFKFKQEFKNNLMELKDYAESTHESVENFLDLCVVALELEFKYFHKALREFLASLGFKGIAQSIFMFVFIAPEFLSEFIDEQFFHHLPTNIRENLIINSMILITGVFHGILITAAVVIYQVMFDKLRVLGLLTASLSFLFFLASTEWFFRQWFYFKSLKKAVAGHILWLYPAFEIRLNRSLVNLYFNAEAQQNE